MTDDTRSNSEATPRAAAPVRVRLPGFIKDEDFGLGDAIKQATYALGFRPCSSCEQRASALNQWIVFTR